MHDFLKKPKRHHVKEIPLAPILDLLTVVIFFLILSASFIEVRQNTLPPSSTSLIKNDPTSFEKIPLNPKLIMVNENEKVTLVLKWFGVNEGQIFRTLKTSQKNYNQELKSNATDIIREFKKNYPEESQLQLGWQKDIDYQSVLTVVDGTMLEVKDLVFISPEESEVLYKRVFK